MIASWNSGIYCTTSGQYPCRPHTDAGETHHLHCPFFVPWCPDKETSISRLRGGFMSAVHELTAVLIRFTKSFGIKVLSKYEMIKIQQQQKMQCPLYFLFWLGNQWCGLGISKMMIFLTFLKWPSATAGQNLKRGDYQGLTLLTAMFIMLKINHCCQQQEHIFQQ